MTCVRIASIIILLASSVAFGKPPARIPPKPLNQTDPNFYAVKGAEISIDGNTASFQFTKSSGTDKLQADFKNVTFFAGEKVIYGTLLNGKPSIRINSDSDRSRDENTERVYKYKLSSPTEAKSFDFAILKRIEPKNMRLLNLKIIKQDPTDFFSSFVQNDWRPRRPGIRGSVSKYSFKSKTELLVTEGWKNPDGNLNENKDIFTVLLSSCQFRKDNSFEISFCKGSLHNNPIGFTFLSGDRKPIGHNAGDTPPELLSTFEVDGIQYVLSIRRGGPPMLHEIFGNKNGIWSEHIEFLVDYYP